MKKRWKIICGILLAPAILLAAFLAFSAVMEYRPAAEEAVPVAGAGAALSKGETVSAVSWNIGFCALGNNADFFMDGGKSVQTADRDRVEQNIRGILETLKGADADIVLLQEIDTDSDRTYHIDETDVMRGEYSDWANTFAYNYNAAFVPYPIPPLGKIRSGIMTLSKYAVAEATRVQLPCPFKWPVRAFNLKRCLLVNRIPVDDRELVLVNLHLEAYDDGAGKAAQANMLREFLESEAAKGNYVIAGGDFNQTFSCVDASRFGVKEGNWQPGIIDTSGFTDGWTFCMDGQTPSCRSLIEPYVDANRQDFQYYAIDGFIVSSNVKVDRFEVIDMDFRDSDHNPIRLTFRLQ